MERRAKVERDADVISVFVRSAKPLALYLRKLDCIPYLFMMVDEYRYDILLGFYSKAHLPIRLGKEPGA